MLIRRLPGSEQSVFRNLFKSTVGQSSEITLASSPIDGNLLTHLFHDNTQPAVANARQPVTRGRPIGLGGRQTSVQRRHQAVHGLLPGKLAYVQFLWQRLQGRPRSSAEALQEHHWKVALENFIAGAAQMVSLGRLSLEGWADTAQVTPETLDPPVAGPVIEPQWSEIRPTAPLRTRLQPFETTVDLKDLTRTALTAPTSIRSSKKTYAPIAGKVYAVNKPGAVWRMLNGKEERPRIADCTRQETGDRPGHPYRALRQSHVDNAQPVCRCPYGQARY